MQQETKKWIWLISILFVVWGLDFINLKWAALTFIIGVIYGARPSYIFPWGRKKNV